MEPAKQVKTIAQAEKIYKEYVAKKKEAKASSDGFFEVGRKAKADAEHYDVNLKQLGKFGTVEDFYSFYCYFKRPSEVNYSPHTITFYTDWYRLQDHDV